MSPSVIRQNQWQTTKVEQQLQLLLLKFCIELDCMHIEATVSELDLVIGIISSNKNKLNSWGKAN